MGLAVPNLRGGWDHGGSSHDGTALVLREAQAEPQAGWPGGPLQRPGHRSMPERPGLGWEARPWTVALVLGTHPRPKQPSLRLTSLCSSPSSKERSSGEKESGSSTACRKE